MQGPMSEQVNFLKWCWMFFPPQSTDSQIWAWIYLTWRTVAKVTGSSCHGNASPGLDSSWERAGVGSWRQTRIFQSTGGVHTWLLLVAPWFRGKQWATIAQLISHMVLGVGAKLLSTSHNYLSLHVSSLVPTRHGTVKGGSMYHAPLTWQHCFWPGNVLRNNVSVHHSGWTHTWKRKLHPLYLQNSQAVFLCSDACILFQTCRPSIAGLPHH